MLTDEQNEVIDTVLSKKSDNKIIAVNSVAGSGKTSTALEVVKALKPNKGFYTAFNRAVIQEGNNKFPNNIECKTLHALAYRYVQLDKPIEDFSYHSIEEKLSYENKLIVIQLMGEFFRSRYLTFHAYMVNTFSADSMVYRLNLGELVNKYISLMEQGYINPTFDFMLKSLHLLLYHSEMELKYDLVMLDECQDVIPVTLEIFKLINSKKKVMLGDTYQNIYGFLNTVNGFELLENTIDLQLTKSFRCTEYIADKVEKFGKKFFSLDFQYKGNPELEYDSSDNSKSYISRTNATVVRRMNDMHHTNQNYSLTRPVKELFSLPIALYNASAGKPVYDKRYKFLETEYKKYTKKQYPTNKTYDSFFQYLLDIFYNDCQIHNAVKTLMTFSEKKINIFDVMKQAKQVKPNPSKVLTTAHAFKGLETNSVYIEDNLNRLIANIATKENYEQEDKENLNVYYVAITRAKKELLNANWCK